MSLPTTARMFAGRLDVAPFACVFFLLVIFLVLLTPLAPAPGVPVQLPEQESPEVTEGLDWLVVVMDGSGRLYFEHQVATEDALLTQLTAKVRAAGGRLTLLLQADAGVQLRDLVRFYDLCRQAGISRVKLQTRQPLGLSGIHGFRP